MSFKKSLLVLSLIAFVGSNLFAQSLAEKDEKKKENPKNNIPAKILGVGTALGAAAVANAKGNESKTYVPKVMTPEEVAQSIQFFKLLATYEVDYGYGRNYNPDNTRIELNQVGFRYRLANFFALRYQNISNRYEDQSCISINSFFFEYYLMPLLNPASGTVTQLGAYTGLRSRKLSTINTRNDLAYGLMYNYYNLNGNYSLHIAGNAAVTRWSDFTIAYTIELFGRYYMGPFFFEAGPTFDLTDANNLRTDVLAKVGVRF